MNPTDDIAPALPAVADESAATPASTPPRRRPRAKAAEVTAASDDPAVGAVPARRPRRKAVADPGAATAADPPPSAARADLPAEADSAVQSMSVPVATAASEPSGDRADAPAADGEARTDAGDERRDRRRNRRRNRREAGEGGAADDAQVVTVGPDDEDQALSVPATELAPVDAGQTFADVVGGAYDAEPEVAEPERRVLAPEPDAPKLHKVLAQAGIGSRRDMEELIAAGQVQVNGQVAHTGQRVSFGDRIAVGGKLLRVRIVPPPARVIAYHKPVGEVVTRDDPQQRPIVFRRLPRLPQGKWQSVGRLDINTEGLLLFTTSGELANQLMHPRFGVEREYAVRVIGRLEDEARERLLQGVDIDGQRAALRSIVDGGGEGVNHWYRIVIAEGRNREVRRMFDAVGLGVSRLIRIRYGCVVLPRGLKRGVWVDLNAPEVQQLRRLAAPGPRSAEGAEIRDGDRSKRNRRNKRGRDGRELREQRPSDERQRAGEGDEIDFGAIPNPLQQTFDKRAIREARQPRRVIAEDGPIPNPLEQTYDRRFVQKPRGQGSRGQGGQGGQGGQPDPMKTALGYIGADAFVRKFQGGGGGRWGGKRGGGGRR